MERRYKIDGMFCSACTKSVEKAMSKIEGLDYYSVNLMDGILTVSCENNIDKEIFKAVKKLGFKIHNLDEKNSNYVLIVSIILSVILFYISMSEMFKFPLPSFISSKINPIGYLTSLFILSTTIIILNFSFYIKGYKALFILNPTMDSLVSIGSCASYILAIISFIKVIIFSINGELELISNELKTIYFDSASMVLVFVSIGKYLEAKAKLKTTNAISKLKKLMPKFCTIILNNEEKQIDVNNLKVDDIVLIKSGEVIPSDGIIVEGKASVNEATITGESIEVFKAENDLVLAGTIITSGYTKIRATKVGKDSTFGEIVSLVENAILTKAPVQRIADKISGVFVPIVLAISIITFLTWCIISKDFDIAIKYAISVLVISCPCSLGLATPVAITTILGRVSQDGIMVKDAKSIEHLAKLKVVAFDKTGTITYGNIAIESMDDFSIEDLLAIKAIESKSSHLIGKAISSYITENTQYLVENFKEEIGFGVSGIINGNVYKIGNAKYINIDSEENKNTIIYVSKNDRYLGKISLIDEIRSTSKEFIDNLIQLNIKPVLISGDNEKIVENVSCKLGIENYYSEVIPSEKKKIIEELKRNSEGTVAYFGDGINDSPALAISDVGISIKGSSDIAISSGSVILLRDNLLDIIKLYKYSIRAERIIKENLFWALIYNVLMIPLAAGCFSIINISLSPVICSICMSLSSIIVVMNALRLTKKL